MGAIVPLQTTARAERLGSPNRMHRTVEFRPEPKGGLPIVGGVPMRVMKPGSKFLPAGKIPPSGAPAGLPYAFGQILLAKAQEDYEARLGNLPPPKPLGVIAQAKAAQAKAASPKKLQEGQGEAAKGGSAAAAAKPTATPTATAS